MRYRRSIVRPEVSDPHYSRRALPALILSADALGAALVGAALELAGFRAAFPREGESAAEAVRRLKPKVVLLDAQDVELREAGVIGPALMTGAKLVFFGPPEAIRDLRVLASAAHATLVALPDDLERLTRLMASPSDAPRRSKQ